LTSQTVPFVTLPFSTQSGRPESQLIAAVLQTFPDEQTSPGTQRWKCQSASIVPSAPQSIR
jgi:phage-related baseplate assembly protein